MYFVLPVKSEGMKLELKIQEIHKENLKSIGRLAFIEDGLTVMKRMIAHLSGIRPGADKEVIRDCSEIDHKIGRLKKTMIQQDCHLLSFLCTGKLVPDEKLSESKQSIEQVRLLNSQYRKLRSKIASLLKSTKR